jgi:hypothetical protein
MECYYHPERDGTDQCAICGKSICKECGLEIAGKIYCKECLEKIVGLGIDNNAQSEPQVAANEPARLNKQPVEESIYQPQETVEPVPEIKQISDDSPYNIKDTTYSAGPESSYISESEVAQQVQIEPEPQISQNEIQPETIQQVDNSQDFIYPDHSYEPQPTSARVELEDKYEKYLDDLYFDEAEVPLDQQLAKDEEEFGSLTRRPYEPRVEETTLKEKPRKPETPEEMEARIRAEILAEKDGKKRRGGRKKKENIHNLNYQDEKEPMGVVDILLTIILIIVILVVIYYLIYIFVLHSTYPTFIDAIYALGNPQNVINNILTPQPEI